MSFRGRRAPRLSLTTITGPYGTRRCDLVVPADGGWGRSNKAKLHKVLHKYIFVKSRPKYYLSKKIKHFRTKNLLFFEMFSFPATSCRFNALASQNLLGGSPCLGG
jgi:hypothetical protein